MKALLYFVSLIYVLVPALAANAADSALPTPIEVPSLQHQVDLHKLPPITQRIPADPFVVRYDQVVKKPGRYGGELRLLMGRSKDIRLMVVYGYARLVAYDREFNLVPDLLTKIDVKEERIFTLHLRKGHKWSDGHPFTAEDFRFWWEDVVNNKKLSPGGPPREMLVDRVSPEFEVIDETTVRFSWPEPNPFFLPALAGARPLYIYMPAHYLKKFHKQYAKRKVLDALVVNDGVRTWRAVFYRRANQYKNDNPHLPTLQPWVNTTFLPSERFISVRNPFYHRIDMNGRQLPYIDRVSMTIAHSKLIPAKTGAGESDLQARHLNFSNFTFLKRGEKRNNFSVQLWTPAKGSHFALYPNLNTNDPVWRKLFRKADFRRALSLAINRREINQVIYFGLAYEGNNTVLPRSILNKPVYNKRWAVFNLKKANALLDRLGLTKRDHLGVRLLPDGRPIEIIVETAGEDSEQSDVLQLIHDSWLKAGIKLFIKPLQRVNFRRRVFAGSTLMSVWFGIDNAVPTALSSPEELAPTSRYQLQWPKWGQHFQSMSRKGKPVDLPAARKLLALNERWRVAINRFEKKVIWHDMLDLYTDQVFSIGLVNSVPQPVVISNRLRNVPKKAIYNWDPGAHFGIYRPDTFWFIDGGKEKE